MRDGHRNLPRVNGSEPAPASKTRRIGRFFDALAVLLIALAAWKFFIQPRFFMSQIAPTPVPDVHLQLMGGRTFDLASARGHVVFLDFWASWCEPCKQSIPLIEDYKAKHPNALVFSVNGGETKAAAEKYARSAGMRRVAFDPQMTVTDAFRVNVFPTMIVIGKDGKERAKWVGFNPLIESDMGRAAQKF